MLRLLKPFSVLYRAGVQLRHLAYDKKWLPSIKVEVPVISVGNIIAGGTGKTPLVQLLAEQLQPFGAVAILSRGYRSTMERSGKVAKLRGELDPDLYGDEPCLLASKLKKAAVWVGKDRVLSARLAIDIGAEVLILDDGMQYRRLHRDLEIVMVRDEKKSGFLPSGMYRDLPERLAKADLIVANGQVDEAWLKGYSQAPIVGVKMVTGADLRGKKVGLFCAIAQPERFVKTVETAGGNIVDTWFKADHRGFSARQLRAFHEKTGAELLVCTEKDAVKLPENLQIPILPIQADLEIISNREAWDQAIQIGIGWMHGPAV
jgi:tetraacyldisaccharide 4'-kinase